MKKFIMVLPAFLLLFFAAPALASACQPSCPSEEEVCQPSCPSEEEVCPCPDVVEVESENRADIENDVTVGTNTGRNDANRNRNRGVISTGSALADGSISNQANSNDTRLNLWGMRGGYIGVKSENDADVNNEVQVHANTGDNEANKNGKYSHRTRTMGVGSISTGNAQSYATLTTIVNSNMTRINR